MSERASRQVGSTGEAWQSHASTLASRSRVARFGDFGFDLDHPELFHHDRPLEIRPKAVLVLAELIAHAGAVVSHDELIGAAWADADADVRASLHNAVADLRSTLRDDALPQPCIETVYGRGYRFVADVQVEVRDDPRAHDHVPRSAAGPRAVGSTLGAFVAALVLVIAASVLADRPRRDDSVELATPVLRAVYQAEHGGIEEASVALRRLRAVLAADPPGSGKVWTAVASAELRLGNFGPAAAAADRALELDPGSAPALRILAMVDVYALRHWERAEARLLRALALQPRNSEGHVAYAVLLTILGRDEEARREARRAWILAPTGAATWTELARVLSVLDDHQGAATALEEALSLDPDTRTSPLGLSRHLTTALTLARGGEPDRAIAWLATAAADNDPHLPLILRHPDFRKLQDRAEYRRLLEEMALR